MRRVREKKERERGRRKRNIRERWKLREWIRRKRERIIPESLKSIGQF